MLTRAAIVTSARSYLGVPFRHQGRDRKGIDCVGLLICVARDTGLRAMNFNITGYQRYPEQGWLEKELHTHLQPWSGAPQPGDVLLFSFGAEPQHVGIATDIGVIHAYARARRCVEHRVDEIWQRRLRGVFMIPEVQHG